MFPLSDSDSGVGLDGEVGEMETLPSLSLSLSRGVFFLGERQILKGFF